MCIVIRFIALTLNGAMALFNKNSIFRILSLSLSLSLSRALYDLLTGVILKGLTLLKFVSDVCVCMFYVCKVIGFVD